MGREGPGPQAEPRSYRTAYAGLFLGVGRVLLWGDLAGAGVRRRISTQSLVYRRLIPGFRALILAEFFAAGLWIVIDYATGVTGHEIFSF